MGHTGTQPVPRDTGHPLGSSGLREAVLGDRVDMLFRDANLALLLTLLAALIFVHFHVTAGAGADMGIWFAALTTTIGLRTLIVWRYRRWDADGGAERWLLAARIGSALTATAWGTAGVIYYPADSATLLLITLLILAGISASALSVMTSDFVSYRNYVLLTLGPAGATALMQAERTDAAVGLLILMMIGFLLRSGKNTAQAVTDALRLRHTNAALLEDLREEKNRLINEAETRMGTVLSCAPIALWSIDQQGGIDFMEGNRLGEQNKLTLPEVGHNMLEAFPDQPQIAYATRRALNGEAFVTEIALGAHSYEVHYSPFPNQDGTRRGAIGVAIDISERKHQERELSHRANFDQLTGLPNRHLIMNQIEHAFEHARRHQTHVALFFLDLDNFKAINDTLGHKAGDELLQQAARRLEDALRESDSPARLGGDEFVVVSEELQYAEDAEIVAHRIVDLFKRPFTLDNREVFATTSVGIAVFPHDGENASQLLQSADTAMYHAKAMGKNAYRFFTNEMQQTAEKHLEIETELRRALGRNELQLMFQPKIEVSTHRIRGAEALLRWHSPTLGFVPPDEFIPVAEYAGLMPDIGYWVLQEACREAAQWQTLRDQPVQIAINVSPQQFRSTDLLANVTQSLVGSGLAPGLLELEITESVMVQDAPETLRTFEDIHALGVTLSLDDFGTGFSSLSYLKKFPTEVLKIDKAFVQDLGRAEAEDDESLVEAIIALAKSLKMEVVAEGVETAEQLAFLAERDVDLVQGYYFSKPLEATRFRELLRQSARLPERDRTDAA